MDIPLSGHPKCEVLRSYGLGKLDDASARAVDRHLEVCLDCRNQVAELSSDSFLGRMRDARETDNTMSGQSQVSRTQSDKESIAAAGSHESKLPPGLADHPDYEFVRELGRGGMGVVYLVHNKLMGARRCSRSLAASSSNAPMCQTVSCGRYCAVARLATLTS